MSSRSLETGGMADDMEYRRSNRTVFGYCLVVALGAMLFGIDQGETTGFLAMPKLLPLKFLKDFGYYDDNLGAYNMTAQRQTLLYGATLGCTVIACIISGPIGARYGRRAGLALCALTSIVGPSIQAGAKNVPAMVVGRAIAGFGIGFAANFVITYWSEATPVELRGLIVVMYQGFINLAQFIGAAINEGTHGMTTRWAYRAPLLTELPAPLLMLAFLPFIPHTPRWFVSRGRIDEGHDALRTLRGNTFPEEEIEKELREIAAFDEIERELEASSSFFDCFKGTDHRRTRIVIMVLVCQQFTGISFITAYGTYFFTLSGINNAFVITVITSVCGIAGSALAFPIIKYFGRRPILIVGAAVSAISMMTFAIVGVAAPNSTAAAKCLVAFTCLNSYANLGTKVGFIFGGCTILTFFWTLFFLPETKGRTLEQIDEMFLNKVPTLKFKDYVCTGHAGHLSVEDQLEKMEMKGVVTEMIEHVGTRN
ncbi:hypothetical protein B7463_g5904, partial [Scytalidium lignicola]